MMSDAGAIYTISPRDPPARDGSIPSDASKAYQAGQPNRYEPPPPHSPKDPDWAIRSAQPMLRDYSRHIVENSSIAQGIITFRAINGLGAGLKYSPQVKDRSGELMTDHNAAISALMEEWALSVDMADSLSRDDAEKHVWRSVDVDGESFVRSVYQPRRGSPIPFGIQIIEADLVPFGYGSNLPERFSDGIRVDEWGRPQTYVVWQNGRPAVEIDAEFITHAKYILRPNQTRGTPRLHAVIHRIIQLANFEKAHRRAAAASAKIFLSLNRDSDWDDGEDPDPRTWYIEDLEILDNLRPGETANFHSPQHPNQNAVDFLREERRQIAVGSGAAFSQIAQYYDRSFSAQRMEMVSHWRLIEAEREKFVRTVARPIFWERPLSLAYELGIIRPPIDADESTLLDVSIQGPPMPLIDPVKERQAYKIDLDERLDSRAAIQMKIGNDPTRVDGEITADQLSSGRASADLEGILIRALASSGQTAEN